MISPQKCAQEKKKRKFATMRKITRGLAGTTALLSTALAESSNSTCSNILSPSYEAPVVGSGWTAQLIATGLTAPRGIVFDTTGALLVVQQGVGILRVIFNDFGGTCLAVNQTSTLVNNTDVSSFELLSETIFQDVLCTDVRVWTV